VLFGHPEGDLNRMVTALMNSAQTFPTATIIDALILTALYDCVIARPYPSARPPITLR
jgi:hypothetical protein